MIKTTRWSPDTCACVIEYTWDDSVPEDQRVHTLANVVAMCPAHAALASHANRFAAVKDENSTKNYLKQRIIELAPAGWLTTDANGNVDFVVPVTFSFQNGYSGPGRVIQVSIQGITAAQRTTLQTAANTRFGAGKVVIL